MTGPSGPEAIGAGSKILLVYGFQDYDDRPLRHLVLEGRNAERPLRAIRLGNVRPAHRRCLVAARLDASPEVHKIGLEGCFIFLPCHTVDASSSILAGPVVRLLPPFQINDVVPREQHFTSLSSRQFGYPF